MPVASSPGTGMPARKRIVWCRTCSEHNCLVRHVLTTCVRRLTPSGKMISSFRPTPSTVHSEGRCRLCTTQIWLYICRPCSMASRARQNAGAGSHAGSRCTRTVQGMSAGWNRRRGYVASSAAHLRWQANQLWCSPAPQCAQLCSTVRILPFLAAR